MPSCQCVPCLICRGKGIIWFDLFGNFVGGGRCDDLDISESCSNCDGTGIVEVCGACYDSGFLDDFQE